MRMPDTDLIDDLFDWVKGRAEKDPTFDSFARKVAKSLSRRYATLPQR